MKKIIYFLLTTENYKDRQENILNSWGKGLDLFFYSEHEDKERNIIKVCNVNNVEIKQVNIFKTIEKNYYNKYEWYFFGDDDTFVNFKLLNKEIDNFDKNKIHGSDIYGCWGDLHYPSGGAGFLIHNNIINKFFDSKIYNSTYSDVTFGLNMLDKNIEIQNNHMFFSQRPEFYNIPFEETYKYITFHYIKTIDEYKYLNDICQKNTIL